MEELTEVITASVFHPITCSEFIYSSSKGTIRLCDMRQKALCDEHAKCKFDFTSCNALYFLVNIPLAPFETIWGVHYSKGNNAFCCCCVPGSMCNAYYPVCQCATEASARIQLVHASLLSSHNTAIHVVWYMISLTVICDRL